MKNFTYTAPCNVSCAHVISNVTLIAVYITYSNILLGIASDYLMAGLSNQLFDRTSC